MDNPKLTITMPIGINFGWGICGRYLTKELSRLSHVELITDDFTINEAGSEEEFRHLEELRSKAAVVDKKTVSHPILQAIQGVDLKPWKGKLNGSLQVGYTFFEKDIIDPKNIVAAKEYYDIIVAGSGWCEEILNQSGYSETETIIQGIDESLFNPENNDKAQYKDKFVIFSGGKLELRKGQDLVINAFKVMQGKYPDVHLVNLWYNQWPKTMEPMQISPYIRFEMPEGDYFAAINHLFQINGIDSHRFTTLPPLPHDHMAGIYKNSDIGLFPNRCEGGTNLALMEYMACGKPTIASYSTGHKDILTDGNSIPLKSLHPFKVQDQHGKTLYKWEEPDLDEIVSALEWAYWHRDDLKVIGRIAGENLSELTWEESAKQFYEILH